MEPSEHAKPVILNYASARSRPYRRSALTIVVGSIAFGVFLVSALLFVTPNLNGGRHSASVRITRTLIRSLSSPLELYRKHVGMYPTSLGDLLKPPLGEARTNWKGPYVDDSHKLLDVWGREFRYKSPGLHNSQQYDLWSTGKDGEDGTDDDIGNW